MFSLPYGSKTIDFSIDGIEGIDSASVEVVEIQNRAGWHAETLANENDLLRYALEHPLKTKRLREIVRDAIGEGDASDAAENAAEDAVKGKEAEEAVGARKNARDGRRRSGDIVIVVDDHTRSTPTEKMLDALIEELSENAQLAVTKRVKVLVACGTHSAPSEDELKRVLGKHYGRFQVHVHNCDNVNSLVYLGETSRGTPVFLNRMYVDAAVRVLTGDITLHYYAGFGGGRKSILPGISGRITIKRNHALLIDENARTGNLRGNPVHEDMCEVAAMAYPDFTLNVVLDANGKIVSAFAGDMEEVFKRGVSVASEIFIMPVRETYDMLIVSAGGFPKDRNLYQASKAIEHCQNAVVQGGTLILVAECRDGIGDAIFEEWMNKYASYESAEDAVKRNFVLGGHKAYYLRKTMRRVRLCIVSSLDSALLRKWGIQPYESIQDAISHELPLLIHRLRHINNEREQTEKQTEEKNEAEREEFNEKVRIGVVKNGMDVFISPAIK